ncbi:MAG: hypothetical protein A2163_00730 [Actinobacteria bacterium RBG_13_35_12]|nr:MAG: hypothetical protein A2163_00730 [Actinobacteria bacterium RBG_13_35_12]
MSCLFLEILFLSFCVHTCLKNLKNKKNTLNKINEKNEEKPGYDDLYSPHIDSKKISNNLFYSKQSFYDNN